MKSLLLSAAAIMAFSLPAHAQSRDDTICNSPLVMFGPVVSVCEAVGAEVPDTELTGLIGGGRLTGDRRQIIGAVAGEFLSEDPSVERLLRNLEPASPASSWQASPVALPPSSSVLAPAASPAQTPHPCDVDPASFACEFQRVVDDVNAQAASNF